MPKPLFITLLIAAPIVLGAVSRNVLVALVVLAVILIANPIIWAVRKNRYFGSEQFQALRTEIVSVVAEHNEMVSYVAEIRARGSFGLGQSTVAQNAHLATFENQSAWNYRRDRNVAEYAPQVHNASLQIVRSASQDPIKYLMKYFSIKADKKRWRTSRVLPKTFRGSRRPSPTSRSVSRRSLLKSSRQRSS
ncbi:MAG: hypothetical protein WDM88_03130 [Galbitalea sp.]